MANDLLQSDGWERFQRALGRNTERIGGVLTIETPMPLGFSYLYSPRGSFPRHAECPPSHRHSERPEDARNLTHTLQDTAKATGAIFWRAEFDGPVSDVRCSVSEPRVMRRFVELEWTWRTSLTESDTTRMAVMHEKHRYNVRLAERRGVRVNQYSSESVNQEQIGALWSLLQDTARRQGIATHPRAYYETMLATLAECRMQNAECRADGTDCRLYFAEHKGVPVAAAIVVYHGDTATYLHGGSSHEHRALMAPHLLHWRAMCDAKATGLTWYDFGGVEPPKTEERRTQNGEHDRFQSSSSFSSSVLRSDWSGMTRFKMGFGGEAVHHPPMRDLVFRPGWYRALSFLARLRN